MLTDYGVIIQVNGHNCILTHDDNNCYVCELCNMRLHRSNLIKYWISVPKIMYFQKLEEIISCDAFKMLSALE